MTRSQKKAWLWLLAIILLLMLLSCGTKKTTITETILTHDTVTVVKTDTVKEVKVKEVRDTTKQIEVHTYTLNNVGDTVKEVHHYHDIMHTLIVDSTERYQAKVDSLQRVIDSQKGKTVVKVVKKPRFIEMAVLVLVCLACIVYVLRKKK